MDSMLTSTLSPNDEDRRSMQKHGLHFEEFQPGPCYRTDRRTLTEADHVNFTTTCGFFEPLFMDRDYVATQTPYNRPIVPGTLTFAVAEGLTILSGIFHATGIALLGVELTILKPVFIGDSITVDIEVLEKRATKKPDRGIVTFRHRVINQAESTVMEYTVKRMIRRKG
jgi:acyl dehydratase